MKNRIIPPIPGVATTRTSARTADPVRSLDELMQRVTQPRPIQLNTAGLTRGIDNYHIDVALSSRFVTLGRELIADSMKKVAAGNQKLAPDLLENFRDSYTDMIESTLHRTKTDLRPEEVIILQFGVIKFVLQESRHQSTVLIQQQEDILAQQQYSGSRNLLATQKRVSWMRQQRDEFLYRVNRTVFKLLQRAETVRLRELREQHLQGLFREAVNVMFNPMLSAAHPQHPSLLMEHYALWPTATLAEASPALEALLAEQLPSLNVEALKRFDRFDAVQSEVFDELGGLFAAQSLLGPAENQYECVSEIFCWLEQPGNIRLLFDKDLHARNASLLKAEDGRRAERDYNSDIKGLLKIFQQARRVFASEDDYRFMAASHQLRDSWSPVDADLLELEMACKYVAGQETRKIAARLGQQENVGADLLRRLDEMARVNATNFKEDAESQVLKILSDYCRYRLHLRYYQLAHRLFNRLHVVTTPDQMQLSKAGGHLYQLLGGEEARKAENVEPEIVHHTIIKADVRGSTTVTQELLRQGLNPASYFSLRFFQPITDLLKTYGAKKVFIEGDAVILAMHEYNNAPEQWYSVSRACGMSKDIIDIIHSKNAYSKQTGLPLLEIGIGIAYANEKPQFLFDDQQPIMISPAIGDADRLSSCTWKLRPKFDGGTFNVAVLNISSKDRQGGDKGQKQLRYNVNGILLDAAGFAKLGEEISLKRVRVKLSDDTHTLYLGKFPDAAGKQRQLVIREGKVMTWEQGNILPAEPGADQEVYYEVLANTRLTRQVLESAG